MIELRNQPNYQQINIHAHDEYAFRYSCYYGHIEMVKYLIELGNQPNYQQINIHANAEEAFRWSCVKGHIETVKTWKHGFQFNLPVKSTKSISGTR